LSLEDTGKSSPVDQDGCGRACGQNGNRRTFTGGASSPRCESSTAALTSYLTQKANADCASNVDDLACGIDVIITDRCFQVAKSVQINGYATYHCGHITC